MVKIVCPSCTGQVKTKPNGEYLVVELHEALVDGNHIEYCPGSGASFEKEHAERIMPLVGNNVARPSAMDEPFML